MKHIRILIVGAGGYGALTCREILEHADENNVSVCGIVDPFIENSEAQDIIASCKIPVFDTLEEFYGADSADLAVISTPIHLHADMSVYCMERGSDVLCEKPIAATVQDAKRMLNAAQRTGRHLTIGYQHSFARATLALKKDILAGEFGAPVSMYTALWWPRNAAYYARPWAAKKRMDGKYALDSIAMNACAHYLHNMLFLLGDDISTSAKPEWMEAALYRANDIEMYDTVFFKVHAAGIDMKYTATHASDGKRGPVMRFEFEKAVVTVDAEKDARLAIEAEFHNGRRKEYGDTNSDSHLKIWHAVNLARGIGKEICTVETALSHLICVNAASEFVSVKPLAGAYRSGDFIVAPGVSEAMDEAFQKGVMPWEVTDAFEKGVYISLEGYESFGGLYDERNQDIS